MARYRIIAEQGAYMARSPVPERLELGADIKAAKAYGVHAPIFELLGEGTIVEGDHIAYGPHLEPLDAEAEAKAAAYRARYPNATLDPTRSLPMGQDPMVRPTFEQEVLKRLEAMSNRALEEMGGPPPAPANDKLDAVLSAVAQQNAMMLQMMQQQTAMMAELLGQVAGKPAAARKGG